MLDYLKLRHVGPAPELNIDLASRLNLLTGDNGLGKTFLLDVAWWALTRTWAGLPAWPQRGNRTKPAIEFDISGKTSKSRHNIVPYDFKRQQWKLSPGRPPMPGVVVYVRVDGGFSVWDPARNYWRKFKNRGVDEPDRPEAYHFRPEDVWNGLESSETVACNGLIRDWVSWQRQSTPAFKRLSTVLEKLSPGPETLRPGEPIRVSIEDARDYPTIKMPYGTVPVIHASAGVRRVVALAYLLVWAWDEHIQASRLLDQDPENRLVFLFDEVETHLHPTWQRVLLPALLSVVDDLAKDGQAQVIAATHAPLVMASVETIFDCDTDRAFHLEFSEGHATIREVEWAKQGDAVGWLVSEVFGLKQARSQEAEHAIEAAEAFMRGDTSSLPDELKSKKSIHRELQRVLAGHDPFWPRWIVKTDASVGDAR